MSFPRPDAAHLEPEREVKERLCAIHQPHYLPWLRYLDKIARADVFVLLDDVQYNKNGWQNRNKIKGPAGPVLLTVPVRHRFQAALAEVEIASQAFRRGHGTALRSAYGRAPGFAALWQALEPLYSREWHRLVELNALMLEILLGLLGIKTPVRRSSELQVPGEASERIANLCRAVGATHYLTGAYAAAAYLDPQVLERAGVGVRYQIWEAPVYSQAHPGAGFVPDLSIVDLLASEPGAALEVLHRGGRVATAMPPDPAGAAAPAAP